MPTSVPPTLPAVIQGGMGVNISSYRLARTVAAAGGLGVISGVAPDLLLARWLQDGDPTGEVRAAMAGYPDQAFVAETLDRYFLDGGRPPGKPYRPNPKLDLNQKSGPVRLTALGAYVQVALAKTGHDGVVGINLLEKVQLWTPAALLGAVLADVDFVLVGAGVPTHLPRVLNGLADCEPVSLPIDVAGSQTGESWSITLDPAEVVPGLTAPLKRPFFLAIVSSNILGTYLARDETTRPDGFVVELPSAGGHNAPPRRMVLDDGGEPIYGPRDEVDLTKIDTIGLPFWVAGGYATPERLREAQEAGAVGVQIGTAFALSDESGMTPPVRTVLRERVRADNLRVRTDPLASPTGFPFKVAQVPGTVADPTTYASRDRICDLSYLRTAYRRDNGSVGYRCASEPVDAYVRKGGDVEDTLGRMCLCNGLAATAGLAQLRDDSDVEPYLVTLGSDRVQLAGLLARHEDGWSALDVMSWLTEPAVTSMAGPAAT
ncbi:MAG: nitronate monooxygenase [Actinomycetota bacterium]|nr:nitronate monooxygenase [Actinomycetota bacterium]MDH4352509.1 nitronate monooxygenase [Actinomycetota bacterium]MDH5278890.1 nitronate monooxygenase [Actinomycetota bacterium]